MLVLKELQKYDQESKVGFLKEVLWASRIYFLNPEVSILKTLSHSNLLQFIGMVSKDSKMLVITGSIFLPFCVWCYFTP